MRHRRVLPTAQPLQQHLTPTMQTRPDGSHRDAEHGRGVGVIELLQIAQDDDLAIASRQRAKAAAEVPSVLAGTQCRARVVGSGRLAGVVEGQQTPYAARSGADDVSRDPEQVRPQGRPLGVIAFEVPHHRQEHILDDVLRDHGGARHRASEPVDDRPMSPVQQRKRLALSAPGPPHELRVRRFGLVLYRHSSGFNGTAAEVPDSFLFAADSLELPFGWRQWPCNGYVKGGSVRRPAAVFILVSLGFLASTTARTQQRDKTHGRDAEPDYARVFAQEVVKRLDIRVTAADWERLIADMTEMAGPRVADGGFGRGGFNIMPDPAAVAACSGRLEGDACSFGTPAQGGRCTLLPMGTGLTCTPLPGGGFPAEATCHPGAAAAAGGQYPRRQPGPRRRRVPAADADLHSRDADVRRDHVHEHRPAAERELQPVEFMAERLRQAAVPVERGRPGRPVPTRNSIGNLRSPPIAGYPGRQTRLQNPERQVRHSWG